MSALMRSLGAAVWLIALGALGAEESGGLSVYRLDPQKSELVVRTWKTGVAASLAHNHVIRASDVTGEIAWDPAAVETAKVSATVKASALIADEPAMLQKFGETTQPDEADRKKITQSMLGEEQLDAAKYPTIGFVSTAARREPDGRIILTGQLTLHGVTRPVTLPVKVALKDGEIVGEGKLRFRTSDFGIKPYSGALGAVKNRDEVELVLHLVGSR
jgi:polyisoprenoid-binding protein YceI